MEMKGEQRIAAPRTRVWEALNDPDVLRQCIPGCQSLEKLADDRLQAVVEIKIGPIGARFNGAVTISDAKPPESYTISGEGQGGTVGSAKGGAKVCLAEDGNATLLTYDVEAQVGGRLAQLGGPIIDATAKQLAGRFFRQFGELVEAPAAAAAAVETPAAAPAAVPQPAAAASAVVGQSASPRGFPAAWLLALLSAALIGFLVGHSQVQSASAEWIGLSVGLLVVVVAAAAFEFGRKTVAPVVVLDTQLLQRLTRGGEA